jgi:hypothetical protein
MGERFTTPRLRLDSKRRHYISLCGAKLKPGSLVDAQLPDGTIIRHLTTQSSILGQQYVVIGMHGLIVRVSLLEHELRLRRTKVRKKRKAK